MYTKYLYNIHPPLIHPSTHILSLSVTWPVLHSCSVHFSVWFCCGILPANILYFSQLNIILSTLPCIGLLPLYIYHMYIYRRYCIYVVYIQYLYDICMWYMTYDIYKIKFVFIFGSIFHI
jgi:hypothetical protein